MVVFNTNVMRAQTCISAYSLFVRPFVQVSHIHVTHIILKLGTWVHVSVKKLFRVHSITYYDTYIYLRYNILEPVSKIYHSDSVFVDL